MKAGKWIKQMPERFAPNDSTQTECEDKKNNPKITLNFRAIKVWFELINPRCREGMNCWNATGCRRYCPFLKKFWIYYCLQECLKYRFRDACRLALFQIHLLLTDCCGIYS